MRLVLAALVLHLILIQPNHPEALDLAALTAFPLELPVILAALVAFPSRLLRGLIAAALTLLAVLKVADLAMFVAYDRSFNPVTDLGLVEAGWRLGSGSIGLALAGAAVAAALAAVALVFWLVWWATGVWARLALPRGLAGAVALVAALAVAADVGQARGWWDLPADPPGAAFTARLAVERAVLTRATLADLAAFTAAARRDAFAGAEPLLDLTGGDVIIVFVESYGRASIDNPLYAPTHTATLRAAEARLAGAGLAMRAGWLTAPMRGGQSWLAHASIASGLWISNQTRYRTMLLSPRRTLFHLAAEAGFRTAAVMPAVTLDWPEGERLGFGTILPAAGLGYRGLPFNWVTMPDQYTLSAFDRLVMDAGDRPLFAQVALISSHAPWVPVPAMIPWEEVGDGTVYDAVAQSGDPPDVVWRDRDRVREQYRLAIDYSLQAVTDWALRHAADAPLLIVLGDHQSAGFVAGSDSYDVPVHVIGPPDVVARIEGWGWTPGLIPAPDLPPWPMDAFRDRFLSAYSSGGPEVGPEVGP